MSGTRKKTLKVYWMNEYDWWADYSIGEARENYIKMSGGGDSIDGDFHEEANMDTLKYKDEDMEEAITFAEQLERKPEVGLFASSEQ